MPHVRSIILSALLAVIADGGHAAEGVASFPWMDELQSTLKKSGITLNATNVSRSALLAALRTVDPGADWISGDRWEAITADREGRFPLTGIRLSMTNGLPVIIDIATNSPASSAGLRTGDLLVGVGTQTLERISLPEALRLLKAGDEQAIGLRYVRRDTTNRVELMRETGNEPALETVELLPNNVGYLKINGLYPGSGRDVVSRVRAWSESGRSGIVLDLRGAGGADTAAVTQIASLFSRGGQYLFAFRDHDQQDIASFRATEGDPVEQPVMVLIDHETRGAAEVLAAVINGSTRKALLIGEPTAGDFLLREPVEIAGHRALVALRVLDTSDGLRYSGQHGVEPTIPVAETERGSGDYEPPANLLDKRRVLEIEVLDAAVRHRIRGDGALERAVDIIVGLKSLNKRPGTVSSEP